MIRKRNLVRMDSGKD